MYLCKADLTLKVEYQYIIICISQYRWLIVDHKNLKLETKLMFNILLGLLYIRNSDSDFYFLSSPLNDTLHYDT